MSGEPLNLLLVDDEPDMVRGLGRILRSRGYRVHVAHNGEEAVRQATELQPDGVLMDIRMPGMNGVEAFRHIRRACPNTFVLFMTAYSDMADEARNEGAVDVLSKPLEVDQVIHERPARSGSACLTKPFDMGELFSLVDLMSARRNAR